MAAMLAGTALAELLEDSQPAHKRSDDSQLLAQLAPSSPTPVWEFKGDRSLGAYVASIRGGDLKVMPDGDVGRQLHSLWTVMRGIGSKAAGNMRAANLGAVMRTNFDLADGTLIHLCVRNSAGAKPTLCGLNDEQVSSQAVDDLVGAAGKAITDFAKEIGTRGFVKLAPAYEPTIAGPCASKLANFGAQKVVQNGFEFVFAPSNFEGYVVGSTVIVYSNYSLADYPERVLIGSKIDDKVELRGKGFDCTVTLAASRP